MPYIEHDYKGIVRKSNSK